MKLKRILLLVLVLAAVFGIYYLKYYLGYASDLRSRPWAYSTDPAAELLVGKWQGSFTDPAGVGKEIVLEVFEPVTEEERQRNASRKRRKRMRHDNKEAFDGVAVVRSRLGEERYRLFGAVEKEDLHRLHAKFSPEDEAKRILPNDTLREIPSGRWEGDRFEVTLAFTRQDAQGHSHTQSGGKVVDGKLVWDDDSAGEEVKLVLTRARQ